MSLGQYLTPQQSKYVFFSWIRSDRQTIQQSDRSDDLTNIKFIKVYLPSLKWDQVYVSRPIFDSTAVKIRFFRNSVWPSDPSNHQTIQPSDRSDGLTNIKFIKVYLPSLKWDQVYVSRPLFDSTAVKIRFFHESGLTVRPSNHQTGLMVWQT